MKRTRSRSKKGTLSPAMRRRWLLRVMAAMAVILVVRAGYLQLYDADFYRVEGGKRHAREVTVPGHRGLIVDRHQRPLAVSSPVDTISADPRVLSRYPQAIEWLADSLHRDKQQLAQEINEANLKKRGFMYLRRQLPVSQAEWVEQANIPGVFRQREYRRYYPDAEITAHLLGFTDIDDVGQEGIERLYDQHLRGEPGSQPVLFDGRGRVIQWLGEEQPPQPGQQLTLSIDRRIQYAAYRALKAVVNRHQAIGGSAVIIDVHTGELLALVNQPSLNPNDRNQRQHLARLRNRAATDLFEPGSTIKPFIVAAGLESRHYTPTSQIDTRPGYMRVGRNTVRDMRNYGLLSLGEVLVKSSNVGVSKIALDIPPEQIWQLFRDLGFGKPTDLTLLGEQAGMLGHYDGWGEFEYATRSFGYGFAVTALQLVQAYGILAADGVKYPLTIERREQPPVGQRVLSVHTTRQLRRMMEGVVSREGTAFRAAIPGYRVAGKTGTVRKVVDGRYVLRYRALFAGLVPASRPRLAAVVMVDEPSVGGYYGGVVAAPVFSEMMAEALRLLGIPPDALPRPPEQLASAR